MLYALTETAGTLDSLLSSSTENGLSIQALLLAIAGALGLGMLISLTYLFTHKKEGYSGSFVITLVMLPTIISVLILLIGSNVARAFSLAGAFSLIRYRSAPGDPKDIAYVFFYDGRRPGLWDGINSLCNRFYLSCMPDYDRFTPDAFCLSEKRVPATYSHHSGEHELPGTFR